MFQVCKLAKDSGSRRWSPATRPPRRLLWATQGDPARRQRSLQTLVQPLPAAATTPSGGTEVSVRAHASPSLPPLLPFPLSPRTTPAQVAPSSPRLSCSPVWAAMASPPPAPAPGLDHSPALGAVAFLLVPAVADRDIRAPSAGAVAGFARWQSPLPCATRPTRPQDMGPRSCWRWLDVATPSSVVVVVAARREFSSRPLPCGCASSLSL
jgi:hypothetical protein